MSLREIIPSSFSNLLSLFGISLDDRRDNTFQLTGDVVPVAIVGSVASIQAISSPQTFDLMNSQGELAVPGAGTLLADTGQLPEGIYAITAIVSSRYEGAGYVLDWRLQRRDAANAVSVWNIPFNLHYNGMNYWMFSFSARLLTNERIRMLTIQASTCNVCQGAIFAQRIA